MTRATSNTDEMPDFDPWTPTDEEAAIVITPSRERDGFLGHACGNPLRYALLARSGPAEP